MSTQFVKKVVYSMNISVKKEIESAWIEYMKEQIGLQLESIHFQGYSVQKVITDEFHEDLSSEDEYSHYILQFFANDRLHLRKYFNGHSVSFLDAYLGKFKGKVKISTSILEDQFKPWFFKDLKSKTSVEELDIRNIAWGVKSPA